MDKLELKALGKINLGLDILGRRENGYHDVRMVMQTVYLYDRVILEKTREPGIEISTNLPYLPVNENNIAYKAAELLQREFGIREGIRISLEKHIPVAAGMAGGSSNAAAVLFGMNRMFDLGLSEEGLKERGVTLGADVPYCIMRGTVLAEGIGEKLNQLPPLPDCYVLIGKPGVSVSTKMAYENLKLDQIKRHPDIDGMIRDIQKGDLYSMTEKMENVFEPGIIERYPVIRKIKDFMKEKGALGAMMSGSGPTVFGIFDDMEKIHAAAEALKKTGLAKTVFAARIYNRNGGTKDE